MPKTLLEEMQDENLLHSAFIQMLEKYRSTVISDKNFEGIKALLTKKHPTEDLDRQLRTLFRKELGCDVSYERKETKTLSHLTHQPIIDVYWLVETIDEA